MDGVGDSQFTHLNTSRYSELNFYNFDEFCCENKTGKLAKIPLLRLIKSSTLCVKITQIINSELDIFLFPEGINDNNTEELLDDVDCSTLVTFL